ncbi:rod-binding protein [Stappia sp.]|uniref:rod-binding protein n=1 Tax=Stappia sp. TaxID=1870903 RepID=UPI003A9A5A50
MTGLAIDNVLGSAQGRYTPGPGSALTAAGAAAGISRQNAEEFEAIFLNTMFQQMFAGLEDGGTWGGGEGSDAWSGMLVEQYADTIAKAGGIGIADTVQRQLLSLQETQGQ